MLSRLSPPPAAALLIALACATGPAGASSPQAWEDLRRDVEAACRTAGEAQIRDPQILVDPFGSQSYGLALLSGTALEDDAPHSLICVYDKATRTVELGGVMALEQTVPELRPDLAAAADGTAAEPAAPATATERLLSSSTLSDAPALIPVQEAGGSAAASHAVFGDRCDTACDETLAALADADREQLEGLAGQIERTVAAGGEITGAAGTVRTAAVRAAEAVRGGTAEVAVPGEGFEGRASCTLYYFGYSGEASRTVGTHQCALTRAEDGTLVVEKTSGERLRAEIRPLVADVSAFVGRTFADGAAAEDYDAASPQASADSEFGNTVGFAAEAGDELVLVSSQRRRFEESDSFFWALAMDRP